jgi:AraC family transcriptional regulator of adaptative response/methylated-DNA-[protein]-cysteine methyltransferase
MTALAIAARSAEAPYDTDAGRWTAVTVRDRRADGHFWYGVLTTGVYCRPQCPSRPARRENVRSFGSTAHDRSAHLRACKRCRPDEAGMKAAQAEAVRRACQLIADAEELPTLAAMAPTAGLSPFHFHRQFKALTGVTPRQYAVVQRATRFRDGLAGSGTVTAVLHDSGFNASSRFHVTATAILGMPPSIYRKGGASETIRYAIAPSSLGQLLVAATDRGICAIQFGDAADPLRAGLGKRFPRGTITAGDAAFAAMVAATVAHAEQPGDRFPLPLDIRGTAFQQRVWQALQAIPRGQTASYREIATAIGQPEAVRAVAGACAANPLALAVPCHRVVRADGDLSGYRWGQARKAELLKREGAR